MEPNFGCSLCPQIAERCCLCSTQRIYLCENCLSTHTRKGDYHPLAPLSTPNFITAQTLPKYIEKLKFVTELRRGVEGAIEEVKTERTKLDEIANRVYEKKANEVYAICSTMYQEIAQYYEKTVKELENLKREISEMLEEKQPLSEEAVKYIELGMHWKAGVVLGAENLLESAIHVSSEAVSLANDSYLRRVIEKPDSQCHCEDCKSMERVLLPSKSLRQSETSSTFWNCQGCGYRYNMEKTCLNCKSPNPAQPPQSISTEPKTNSCQTWKCRQCGNENSSANQDCASCKVIPGSDAARQPNPYQSQSQEGWTCSVCNTLNYSQSCTNCASTPNSMLNEGFGNSQGASNQPVNMKTVSNPPRSRESEESDQPQFWTCEYCTHAYNTKKDTACICCNQPQSSTIVPSSCWECGKENLILHDRCFSCKTSRVWEEFLMQKGVELSEDRKRWKCKKCKIFMWMDASVCTYCGEENEVIAKARAGKANRSGITGFIKGLF